MVHSTGAVEQRDAYLASLARPPAVSRRPRPPSSRCPATGSSPSAAPAASAEKAGASSSSAKADLSSLGSMLQARWKSGGGVDKAKPEGARAGEIRQFRIVKLDAAVKKIELELA